MSAEEVLEKLREADTAELEIVRDTAESLLAMGKLDGREVAGALAESEAQFERGEGIPSGEAWRRLGI